MIIKKLILDLKVHHSKPHLILPVDLCTILNKAPGDYLNITIVNAAGKLQHSKTIIHPEYKLYGRYVSDHISNSDYVELIIDNTR